jgi:L-threonylcarbamoyladenylate synthase
MNTIVLAVDPRAPDSAAIARAAAVLRRGGLVAFPTETVYGLGADALDADAVRRIFEAKGRPARNPVIVHVVDAAGAREVAAEWPVEAERLTRRFWPGPLTLVLPKRPCVPDVVTAGGATVAVRVPAHEVALALIRAVGRPLAAPSANRSTRLSPTTAQHVLRDLEGVVELILDGGPTTGGLESTVLSLASRPFRLLRPGLVTAESLEAIVGPIEQGPAPAGSDAALPSPGLLARHYAPRTPVECLEGEARARLLALLASGQRVAWLTFGPVGPDEPGVTVRATLPPEPVAAAAGLYAALHDLDDRRLDRIVVTLPPDEPGWSAVRDRLRRASAPA